MTTTGLAAKETDRMSNIERQLLDLADSLGLDDVAEGSRGIADVAETRRTVRRPTIAPFPSGPVRTCTGCSGTMVATRIGTPHVELRPTGAVLHGLRVYIEYRCGGVWA
jgi:hypothetical protein